MAVVAFPMCMRFVQGVLLLGAIVAVIQGCTRVPVHLKSVSAPSYPEADEIVTSPYTFGTKSKIEVVAIASVEGDTVRCWSPDGSTNAVMEQHVRDSLKSLAYQRKPGFAPIKGKKNRIVIFRASHSGFDVNFLEVGDRNLSSPFPIDIPYHYSGLLLPVTYQGVLARHSGLSEGFNFPVYVARSVAVDESVKKTSALISMTRSMGTSTLQMKVGATCRLNGRTAKVKSISLYANSNSDPKYAPWFGNRKVWQVQIETPLADRKGFFEFRPLVIFGQHMPFVDQKGRRVPEARVEQVMEAERRSHLPNASENRPFFSQTFFDQDKDQARPIDGVTPLKTYYFNMDPRDLKVLTVTCNATTLFMFKDIPLF